MRGAIAFASGIALLGAAPASAQDKEAATDLDCVLYMGSVVAGMRAQGASEMRILGATGAIAFFIGRYEGAGGKDLNSAIAARFEELKAEDFAQLQPICAARMGDMRAKLAGISSAISQAQDKRRRGSR